MSGHKSSHEFADGVGGGVAFLAIILIVLLAFVLFKCVNLIIRVLVQHSKNKLLWALLLCWIGSIVITILTKGHPIPALLAVVSFLALVLCCRIIELYHAQLFGEKGVGLTSVLRRPWWQGNTNTTIAA